MSRGETLSIMALYHYNDTLFSPMVFPEGFTNDDKETVISNILAECAELELLFANWYTMYDMIKFWSKLNLPEWQRIYTASKLTYNPIENYNRVEIETISNDTTTTHSGNDITRQSGSDTSSGSTTTNQTNTGSDSVVNSQTAYDNNTLYTHDKSENTISHTLADSAISSGSIAYGKTDTLTHGEKIENENDITRTNNTSGNIGVTTSQQMLEQEIEVSAKLNVMKMIVESFKDRFCILVY